MRDVGAPPGIAALGYGVEDLPALVQGAASSSGSSPSRRAILPTTTSRRSSARRWPTGDHGPRTSIEPIALVPPQDVAGGTGPARLTPLDRRR
jgi:hypothetical protein